MSSDTGTRVNVFRTLANPNKMGPKRHEAPLSPGLRVETAPVQTQPPPNHQEAAAPVSAIHSFAQQAANTASVEPSQQPKVPMTQTAPATANIVAPSIFQQAVATKTHETAFKAPVKQSPKPARVPSPVRTVPTDVPEYVDSTDVTMEKQASLLELQRLRQQGVNLSKNFTMEDSLQSMQFEIRRHVMEMQEGRTLGLMRDGMSLFFTGLEMANQKFGPVLDLNGWAAEVCKDKARFDPALARLYRKYYRRSQMSAEMELMMAVGASAVMYHMSRKFAPPSSIGGGRAGPQSGPAVNPMEFASMFTSMAGGGGAPPPAQPVPRAGSEGLPPDM